MGEPPSTEACSVDYGSSSSPLHDALDLHGDTSECSRRYRGLERDYSCCFPSPAACLFKAEKVLKAASNSCFDSYFTRRTRWTITSDSAIGSRTAILFPQPTGREHSGFAVCLFVFNIGASASFRHAARRRQGVVYVWEGSIGRSHVVK